MTKRSDMKGAQKHMFDRPINRDPRRPKHPEKPKLWTYMTASSIEKSVQQRIDKKGRRR